MLEYNIPIDIIEERITELTGILTIKLSKINSYSALSEIEKIPFRIMQAEIVALKGLSLGDSLENEIRRCIEKEYYCGAEGIRRIRKWCKGFGNFTKLSEEKNSYNTAFF